MEVPKLGSEFPIIFVIIISNRITSSPHHHQRIFRIGKIRLPYLWTSVCRGERDDDDDNDDDVMVCKVVPWNLAVLTVVHAGLTKR